YFALTDPHLHAQLTVGCLRLAQRVVDIRTEGVQWNSSFFVLFGTGHLSAANATGNHHLDSLSAHAHGGGKCSLHGTTERNPGFQLTGNAFANQLRIHLRPFDLKNVDLNVFLGQFLQLFFDLVHLLAAFSDNDPRSGRMDGHGNPLQGTFNNNFRHAALGDPGTQVLTDFFVFYQFIGIVVTTVPV